MIVICGFLFAIKLVCLFGLDIISIKYILGYGMFCVIYDRSPLIQKSIGKMNNIEPR
jgi:hypothetical protein